MLCMAGGETPPSPNSPAETGASRRPLPAHSILSKSVSPRPSFTQSYKHHQRPLVLCKVSPDWQHKTSTWFFFP